MNVLNNKEPKKITSENDFIYIIKIINDFLSLPSDNKYKKEIDNKFKTIFDKYIAIINNILLDDELLMNTNYSLLEEELKKEINPLLELLDNYLLLEKYKNEKINSLNLMDSLITSMDIVKKGEISKITEEDNYNFIISLIKEINNEIISNELLDKDTKNKIITDLLVKLNNQISILKTNKIESVNEYNEIVRMFLADITEIKVKIEVYLSQFNRYNEYSKKITLTQ